MTSGTEQATGWAKRAISVIAARPITAAVVATAVVSAMAIAFPGLDRLVAGLFHHGDAGFPAERNATLIALRNAGRGVTQIAVMALVVAALGKLFLPLLSRAIGARPLLFLATSLALGPGLLVNAFLKEVWGRPRPRDTLDFGGTLAFDPAWIPGGGCESNCSFPSGEASSSMWLVALAFVVPLAWRRSVAAAALLWCLVVSVNRIAFGGHYLSDVLIGWGLVAIVVLVCRRFFLETMGPMTEARIDAAFGRAGDRVLALAGRRDPSA